MTGMRYVAASVLLAFSTVLVPATGLAELPPNPIDPNNGEQNLIDLINSLPINDIEQALDNFPVPYVFVGSAGGAAPVVANAKAGSPKRYDIDDSKATGKGGRDVQVEVNTELNPPRLVLTINRIGNAPFAEDVTALIAFPFDAFNDEVLPGAPNLFIGYQTTAAFDGAEYPPGGNAPESVEITLTPGVLGGTDHTFEIDIATTGAANPVRFLMGHFDGDAATGILNTVGISAHTDPVPATIALGLDVASSAILLGGATTSSVSVSWDASEPSHVIFDYLENEDFPFTTPDYNTTLTFDQMPTSEQLTLDFDAAAGTLALTHAGSAPIDAITLLHEREDGLLVTGAATDVPTAVAVEVGTPGSVTIDVNANTMDLALLAIQEGGFPGTDAFFGYDIGYVAVEVDDIPDLTANFDAANDSFAISAANLGESIPRLELVIDDDGALDGNGDPINLDLAPSWDDVPTHHVFSLVDDGTHGTAAARLVDLATAALDLNATDIAETYDLVTTAAAPMQAFLRTAPASQLIPGHDIEATCDIDDVPAGEVEIDLDLPPPTISFGYTVDPPQGIDSFSCVGHVDTLNFDVAAADLPPVFSFEFDPEGSLTVIAEDGTGPETDTVGLFAVRLWDEDLGSAGLPSTDGLLGVPLRDARARVDDMPSFQATWADGGAGTTIDYDTDAAAGPFAFFGGAQVSLSTEAELVAPLPDPAPAADHYARFLDEGAGQPKRFAAGAFGVDQFSYASTEGGGDRDVSVSYAADEDHRLVVDVDSTFGGRFFPDFDVAASLVVDDVPQTFSLATDLATRFDYTASDAIDEISLIADVDTSDDATENGVHVELLAQGLPAAVDFDLDPATGATLAMDDALDLLSLTVSSPADIFGSGYQLLEASLTDVPAKWVADWAGGDFLLEATDAADNPAPLGQIAARVSTSSDEPTNAAKEAPFTTDPAALTGPVLSGSSGGCRINYTPYLQEIDFRYYDAGGATAGVLPRLRALYCDAEILDPGEDHVIVRLDGGAIDYASAQLTGFQLISIAPDANGGEFELRIPVPGVHPLFGGFEDGGEFTMLQIANVPDEMTLAVDIVAGSITYDANVGSGEIDLYQGPAGTAGDGADALRVLLDSTPTELDVSWDLDTTGSATFDISSPIEVGILTQDGADRIVGGLVVGDLTASWNSLVTDVGVDFLDPDCIIAILPAPGASCGTEFIEFAQAGFDFDATPGIDGFLNVYNFLGGPAALIPPDEDPAGGGEYVPRLTFALRNFSQFDAEAAIQQCISTLFGFPCIPIPLGIGLDIDVGTDIFSNFTFDFWDFGESPGVITGEPDYRANNPWHIVSPILHGYGSHFDPFN